MQYGNCYNKQAQNTTGMQRKVHLLLLGETEKDFPKRYQMSRNLKDEWWFPNWTRLGKPSEMINITFVGGKPLLSCVERSE